MCQFNYGLLYSLALDITVTSQLKTEGESQT